MNNHRYIIFLIGGLILVSGCASGPKPVHQRGWIGGIYLEADTSLIKTVSANVFEKGSGVMPVLPETVRQKQKRAVFVSRVFDQTPLAAADIREGDLILSVNDEPVTTLKKFRKRIDGASPGDGLSLSILRGAEPLQKEVTVGMETYQHMHVLSLGFRLSSQLDPLPHPDFNLLGLLSYEKNNTRLELHSPEYRYFEANAVHDGDKQEANHEKALANWEGWDAWCLILGLSGKKIICDQTSVPAVQGRE